MQLEILKFLQGFSSPFLDRFFELITITAEENIIIIIAAILLWCLNKELGYRLGFICLTGNGLNIGLKETFRIARPIGVEGIKSIRVQTATGYSFPSGHTQGATMFWMTLMINIKKRPLYIVGALMLVLVGISRMYLGVHWPIDVAGGILIGIVWAILINMLYDHCKRVHNKSLFLIIIIPMLAGLFFFHEEGYVKACGAIAGFYLGYLLEDKYIKYNTKAKVIVQILKFIIGIAVLLGLKSGLKIILPSTYISDFARYMLISLWVTIGAPYVFYKLFSRYPDAVKKSKVNDIVK